MTSKTSTAEDRPIPPMRYRFLRLSQVCMLVGLCKSTVYNLTHAGEFPPYYKQGRVSLWRSDDVQAWMDSRKKMGDTVW